MNTEIDAKYELLKKLIKELGSVVVGFSGGVDSTFLSKVCHDILGDKAIAVTLVSPMIPKWDIDDSKLFTSEISMEQVLVEEKTISHAVSLNPVNRCYHCKKKEFGSIIEIARKRGIIHVLDGSNADDNNDYRPGAKAMEELNIISPLKIVCLTKAEIRQLSHKLELPTWDKPAYACLASRIPYGEEITIEKLNKIEKAELYLHSLGFYQVRVRNHGDIARIELNADERSGFCKPETMDQVSKKLKELGFLYVCFELEGYTMGSLNKKYNV